MSGRTPPFAVTATLTEVPGGTPGDLRRQMLQLSIIGWGIPRAGDDRA
jgi:hypothetical protein